MIIYQTEDDYLSDFDNGTMTPLEFFCIVENKTVGFAFSASERILFASYDATVQFTDVYVQGDLTVYGEISNP